MSTWICSRTNFTAALFSAALLLPISVTTGSALRGSSIPLSGSLKMPVLEETVVIQGPIGFCIDRLASLDGTFRAFVLLASCQATTGELTAPAPDAPGLLTASIDGSDAAMPDEGDLTSFFASRSGRAALSRTGNPDAMSVGVVYTLHDVLYFHAREHSDDPVMGGQSWRAVFTINGRLVTATFRDLADHPISAEEGFRTVEQFVEAIVAANPTTP